MARRALTACCLLVLASPATAGAGRVTLDRGARATSFTVHGPAVLTAGPRTVGLRSGATRVELARSGGHRLVRVGERIVTRLPFRAVIRLSARRVTDRVSGHDAVSLLAARLLARSVHPGWLRGRLAGRGAWMRGMPGAALWRVGILDRRRRAAWFRRAARETIRLRGAERSDTHDVGLLYGEGAAFGYDAGCAPPTHVLTRRQCRAMRTSATTAADHLAAMVRANAPGRLLPTHLARCPDCPPAARETIVDSMINVGLLAWAERQADRGGYAQLAVDHARAAAGLLVRANGCTAQAVFTDPTTGAAFGIHTHQGLSAESTWARGQAWAMLGFTRLARDTGDTWTLGVSRAVAGCWLAKAPRRGLARFDLDASAGPPDSSAQAIAAAALAALARLDPGGAPRWRAAARAQLRAAETAMSAVPPLGRFGGQTYVAGGDRSDEDVELPIAQLYALDAHVTLAR